MEFRALPRVRGRGIARLERGRARGVSRSETSRNDATLGSGGRVVIGLLQEVQLGYHSSVGDVSLPVTKRLFAVSGNRCAFPGCMSTLVTSAGVVTGRICHIHAASENGPRWDPNLGEKRHEFDNLLLMCGPHHDEIDKQVDLWPASRLRELKRAHESTTDSVPADDATERVARQLLELFNAEAHGVMIGSIHADNVAVISGQVTGPVVLGGGAKTETASLLNDRAKYEGLIHSAEESGLIEFLRQQTMGASFRYDQFGAMDKMIRTQGQLQARLFDEQVEKERGQFTGCLRALSTKLATYGSMKGGGHFRITTEEEFVSNGMPRDQARALFQGRASELDRLADDTVAAFERLFRVGRERFYKP